MQVIMQHRPKAAFPWRIPWIDLPRKDKKSRSDQDKVAVRAYLALDCQTRVQRIAGVNHWTHVAPQGLSGPLSRVYKHVATQWLPQGHPSLAAVDSWIHDNIPDHCAYREIFPRCDFDLTLYHRWRLARREDIVAYRLVHG